MPTTFPRYAARAKTTVQQEGESGDADFFWAAYFNSPAAVFTVGWPVLSAGTSRMVLSRIGTPTLRIGTGGA